MLPIVPDGAPKPPRLVQRANKKPGKCIITGDIDGPFIDCGIRYNDGGYWNWIYLHTAWLEQMCTQFLDMVPRSDYEAALEEHEETREQLEALQIAFDALTNAKKEVIA